MDVQETQGLCMHREDTTSGGCTCLPCWSGRCDGEMRHFAGCSMVDDEGLACDGDDPWCWIMPSEDCTPVDPEDPTWDYCTPPQTPQFCSVPLKTTLRGVCLFVYSPIRFPLWA